MTRDWAHLFPRLPHQSEANRRIRWLRGAFKQLRVKLAARLPEDDCQQIDTSALPVKHTSRVRGPDGWTGPDGLHARSRQWRAWPARPARGWYVMLQRGNVGGIVTRGLCIQGFVAGAALVGMPGLLLAGILAGTFFGAAASGLFFAMAIGRRGCFFTGCCVGRPTASLGDLAVRRAHRRAARAGPAA